MNLKKNNVFTLHKKEYKLSETIGEGGAGTVWLAKSYGEKYAVKYLKKTEGKNLERFKNEIAFCEKSHHENIINIIGTVENDEHIYYVMPYYSSTFRDIISNTDMSINKRFYFIQKLSQAIKYIHEQKIIHRDIKPENILIEGDKLVLADFGIAHFSDSTLTKNGDLLANRNYLAPEQKLKKVTREVTSAADIFALGSIINECFTQENPAGSLFKRISDVYPILSPLDELVYSMMKQNPLERPTINEVVLELKLIFGELNESLEDIKESITPSFDVDLNEKILELILDQASEDILTAEYFFKSDIDINKYNHNYHMNIGYTVDGFMLNMYFQQFLYKECKHKFRYESNVYQNGDKYTPLNLEDDKKHIELYAQLKIILAEHPVNMKFDLSGEILKLFSSCCDYHCKEILNSISSPSVKKMLEDLSDAPIIYIVILLKNELTKNKDQINKLYLRNHISINWDRTRNFEISSDNINLFKPQNKEEEIILLEFQNQWNIVFSKTDTNQFSIKFETYSEYLKFKDYSLNLSKSHYIFEGDVLDLIRIKREYNSVIELESLHSFDITNTLSKILGLRHDF